MCHIKHLEYAWYAYRAPSDDRVTKCQGLAMRTEEADWSSRGRRCLTAIERHYPRPIIEQEQCPATDARGLWLGQPQHHLRCNSRIDSRTALLQDAVAGLSREGIGRRNHRPICLHHGIFRKASGAFRRYIRIVWNWWNVHGVTRIF